MLLTFDTVIQNFPLVALAFILGALILFYPVLLISKKKRMFTFVVPGVIFVPSLIIFLIGLGDTSWSIFSKTLIGALGISLALGALIDSLVCAFVLKPKIKEEE